MDDLANAVGMSKKTIYGAFISKEDLIAKVIKIHLDQDEKAKQEFVEHVKRIKALNKED